MASLFINDLDAGAGRMGDATQVRRQSRPSRVPGQGAMHVKCSWKEV